MTRFSSSMASMRRTRSTSQMERGVPLSRMALMSRLVGACRETSCKWLASRAPAVDWISGFVAYSKWLRVQKISTPWKPAPAICSRSSVVNFLEINKYVESSLCIILLKIGPSVSHGSAVMAWVGSAQAVAIRWINRDGVDDPDVADAARGVSAGVQGALEVIRKTALHRNTIGQPLVVETRRIDSCLRLHAKAHPVQNAKKRRGNNTRTARRAGHETEFAIAKENRRRHGAERAMAGGDRVSFGLHQPEERIRLSGMSGEIV